MTAKAAQKISLWEFFQQLGKTFMLPVALLVLRDHARDRQLAQQ
jgi:hypothetical protein